jgi:hypothetical protein
MAVPTRGILHMLPIKVLFRRRIPFTRIGVTAVFVPTQISLGACLHCLPGRIQLEVLVPRPHVHAERVAP